jgi:phage gp37-like protein/energy-coupling factor transporter ATP-binding protein EcfA2
MKLTTNNDPVGEAEQALSRLEGWMEQHVRPLAESQHPAEWARWQHEIQAIHELLNRPNTIEVALVGTTGAGKSTLLNSLLGVQLLQVGVAQSITSFVTRVAFDEGPGYRVEIDYSSRAEWATEVQRFIDAARPGDDDTDGEAKSIVNNLRRRVEAVHQVVLAEPEQFASVIGMPPAPEAEKVFSGASRTVDTFADVKSMVGHLRSVVRAESPVWPLVKQVKILGPFDLLQGGVELVDLPGTNDLNDARVDVTREFIRNAPFVWLVFSMKRGITADGRELLEREKILRTLVLSGSYQSLQLIGTHADDVDSSVAEQFGLDPDDHTQGQLVAAYRQHFIRSSRPVLEQIVDGLLSGSDDAATVRRLRELASQAPIHAVSASAFIRMTGIVKSTVDTGLANVDETGIPAVRQAVRNIADAVGAGLTGRAASQRVHHLYREIADFFRGRAAAGNPLAARAKAELDREVARMGERTAEALTRARIQLEERREAFLGRVKPMLGASVQGVSNKAGGWSQINWATLRAIVNREGVFKSPSTGRRYDLNEDVVDPLLNQLPAAWEAYFTGELGAVRERLAQRLADFIEDYVGRAQALSAELGGASQEVLQRQMAALRERLAFDRQQCELQVAQRVAEIRRQAANGMHQLAKDRMVPAYGTAAEERGTGMKARMLGHLQPAARSAATPIFDGIERDLIERLAELESLVVDLFELLERACIEQAGRVAQNVNLDIDEARLTPQLRALFEAMPTGAEHALA